MIHSTAIRLHNYSVYYRLYSTKSESKMRKLLFSYGSNGTNQLRARVQNDTLTSKKALVNDYARVFCLESSGWGTSGVASLSPKAGNITRGSVVELTPHEMKLLDAYEVGYHLIELEALVEQEPKIVCAYVVDGCPSMICPPSEQYLCAIHIMLREHWDMKNENIQILSQNSSTNSIVTVDSWQHPGIEKLTLCGLFVEVNSRRSTPWKMPQTMNEIVSKLKRVDIYSTHQLLVKNGIENVNKKLKKQNEKLFGDETIKILNLFATKYSEKK
eukprot:GSMAST32.ASY1.ANO1.57.1 assembled CDS